jgi:quercetin dioxygenase-like cupin family protein
MESKSPYPTVNRFITTHNAQGQAVFSDKVPAENAMVKNPDDIEFALSYTTKDFPVSMASDADIATYQHFLEAPPGLTVSNGSVLRHVDIPPGVSCKMHRTVSLDYGILLEGEIECVLDSGETRQLRRGDVVVQRGTMHAWRNPNAHEWSRMVFVLLPCKPIELAGNKLGEELDNMPGVRASD